MHRFSLMLGCCAALAACAPQDGPGPASRAATPVSVSTSGDVTGVLNAVRRKDGRGTLRPSPRLNQVAARHAQDMTRRGYLGHVSPDGGTLSDRLRAARYGPCIAAENWFKGPRDAAGAIGWWMNSPGHRSNILHPRMTEYGLARSGDVWVMVLGAPGC